MSINIYTDFDDELMINLDRANFKVLEGVIKVSNNEEEIIIPLSRVKYIKVIKE